MCKFLTTWSRHNVLALVDIIVTVFTLAVIEYAYIINRKLVGEVGALQAQNEEEELDSPKTTKIRYYRYIGRGLIAVGISALFGIVCCATVVLREKFEDYSPKLKNRIIIGWIILNALTVLILSLMWGGFIFLAATDYDKVSAGPEIHILFGLCNIFRCGSLIGVWNIRKSFTGESQYVVAVDVDK